MWYPSDDEEEEKTNTVTISKTTNIIEFNASHCATKLTETCRMTITVEEKIYKHDKGEPHVYYIDYSYEFIEKNGKIKKSKSRYKHPSSPFYKFQDAEFHFNGEIVYKNEMIEKMVKYLLMPMDELEKYSGTTCPKDYKKQIIRSIALFWS